MKKRILTLVMAATMMIASTVTALADTTTGLVGQYNFDGTLNNEVTGQPASFTGKRTTKKPVDGETNPVYVNGVTNQSILFEGALQKFGLELTDCAPKTNTFTISYDIYYTGYNAYSPALFLSTSWDEATAQWINLGVGHKADLSYAAGMWVRDAVNKNPQEWVDIWAPTGTPSLINEAKEWNYWTNITYVVDGGFVKIYVDGTDIGATGTINGTAIEEGLPLVNVITDTTRLFVGVNAFDDDRPLMAAMDNLCIYDRALTPEDVAELISTREYDIAFAPEKEEATTKKPLEKNTAGADELIQTTAAVEEDTSSGFPIYELILVLIIVAIVAGIAILFVKVLKKKPDYELDDDEY